MRIAGNYTFEATREEVWSALNDPEVLARTIPGCQRLDQVGENEYESTLKVGLQAVRGTYNGRVKINNQVVPESYDIHVDGKGSNGFLKGTGSIKLRPDGEHTILDYGGEAQVGGTIASVGQRLLDGAAKTLINQSLKALAAQIAERRTGSSANGAAPAAPSSAPEPAAVTAQVGQAVAEAGSSVKDAAAEAGSNVTQAAAEAGSNVAQALGEAGSNVREALAEAGSSVGQAAVAAGTSLHQTVVEAGSGLSDAVQAATGSAGFERRSITVAPGQGLSDTDVALGAIEDFIKERPWLPWLLVVFLLGYILGKRN